jgi:hypothetical protein
LIATKILAQAITGSQDGKSEITDFQKALVAKNTRNKKRNHKQEKQNFFFAKNKKKSIKAKNNPFKFF